MSDDRKWNDGRPYYCAKCGCGLGEFMACELTDCKLESEAVAQQRKRRIARRDARRTKSAKAACQS